MARPRNRGVDFLVYLIIRLVVGKDWKRELAMRLPSLPHLLLVLAGFPALPILASGAYLLAKEYIPGIPFLPALMLSVCCP